MPFGFVFLDGGGAVWTVDVRPSGEPSERSLVFSRPSFLDPMEQRSIPGIPDCWPECSGEELRALLGEARQRGRP